MRENRTSRQVGTRGLLGNGQLYLTVAKEMLYYATFCYIALSMSTVIRISDNLAKEAKTRSKVEHRSMTSQLEYWATIGKAAEENPDLPFSFIKETLLAIQELKEHPKEEYTFG